MEIIQQLKMNGLDLYVSTLLNLKDIVLKLTGKNQVAKVYVVLYL